KGIISNFDTAINKKDIEYNSTIEEITKNPFIKSTTTQKTPTKLKSTTTDSLGRQNNNEKIEYATTVTIINVPNPKQQLIVPLQQAITNLRKEKSNKEDI